MLGTGQKHDSQPNRVCEAPPFDLSPTFYPRNGTCPQRPVPRNVPRNGTCPQLPVLETARIVGRERVGIPVRRRSSRRRSLQVCYGDAHRSIGFQPVFCAESEGNHVLIVIRCIRSRVMGAAPQAGSLCSCARQLNTSAAFELVFRPRNSTHCWQ